MAQVINSSDLNKDIIINSDLVQIHPQGYLTDFINYPLSTMDNYRFNMYTYIMHDSYRFFQNMLRAVNNEEDPFDTMFSITDGTYTYKISDLIQYYREHPRNFGFIARKTITARAGKIGKAINLGEVAFKLKEYILNILRKFNTLFVDDIYTNEHFWQDQSRDIRQIEYLDYLADHNSYCAYNVYNPIFKFEKDLTDFLFKAENLGCSNFMNCLLNKCVTHFGNAEHPAAHYYERYLIDVITTSDVIAIEKSKRIAKYNALSFSQTQARGVIFPSLCLYINLIIEILINTIIINGMLRDQRKERNRLFAKKNLIKIITLTLVKEDSRYSSQLCLLASFFAGFDINKTTIISNLDNLLKTFKEGFSVPTLVRNRLDENYNTMVIKNKDLWKDNFISLERDIQNIKELFEDISNISNYLYGEVFKDSDIEKSVQTSYDTTKPIVKLLPVLLSPIFKNETADNLNNTLFEKLVVAPTCFTKITNSTNNTNATDFTFSYNDFTKSIIDNIRSTPKIRNTRYFTDIFLESTETYNTDSIHGENLCASSLDNKRFYFLLQNSADIFTNSIFTSGIYTQYVSIKESLGILLTYLVFILNHETRTVGESSYRYAPRCPADVTIYTEDK